MNLTRKRTESKNPPVNVTDERSVAPDVKTFLPNVLIDYLWQLALCENWKFYEQQLFILQIGELSGCGIQDIYHSRSCGNPMEGHRVYGVAPVNCTLQVLYSDGRYEMRMYKDK